MEPIHPSQKKTIVARVNSAVITEYQVASTLQSLLEPHTDTKGKLRLPQQEVKKRLGLRLAAESR